MLFPLRVAQSLVERIPASLLQPAVDIAVAGVLRRHGEIVERLEDDPPAAILIEPSDLPFAFLLTGHPKGPRLRVVKSGGHVAADARIAGSLATLLDLAEGRIDGDALFFSRRLSVTGDTGAVVSLRNALDSAGIDLFADSLALLGPLAGPLGGVLRTVAGMVASALAADMPAPAGQRP